jgi:hypothetical protein
MIERIVWRVGRIRGLGVFDQKRCRGDVRGQRGEKGGGGS